MTTASMQRLRGYVTGLSINSFPFDVLLILLLPIFLTYSSALSIPPVHIDMLQVLEVVSKVHNPIDFFTLQSSMWDTQAYYRPFFLLTFWVPYQLFGVRWFPNQLINILMHMLNAYLIWDIARRHQLGREAALIVALLYSFSIYTGYSVTWTVARTALLVGTFLLLALHHYATRMDTERPANALYLGVLSILAILSKESGIVVPALIVFASVDLRPVRVNNFKTLAVGLGIIGGYLLLRVMLFGGIANSNSSYEVSPILLLGGRDYYTLPPTLQNSLIAKAEVIFKNVLAVFVPVFNNQGTFPPLRDMVIRLPLLITPVLVLLTASKKLTRFQQYALVIIAVNGVVHFPFFSHYLLYIGQIGLCVFLAASPRLIDRASSTYRWFVPLAIVLLFTSAFFITRTISGQVTEYNIWLNSMVETKEEWRNEPNSAIKMQIVERYGK
jgi:hypothetical protein